MRDGNLEIYVMDAVGGNQERLTNNPSNNRDPDWSPDGTKIAFSSAGDDGKGQIYVMNADGSHLKKLTDTGITPLRIGLPMSNRLHSPSIQIG